VIYETFFPISNVSFCWSQPIRSNDFLNWQPKWFLIFFCEFSISINVSECVWHLWCIAKKSIAFSTSGYRMMEIMMIMMVILFTHVLKWTWNLICIRCTFCFLQLYHWLATQYAIWMFSSCAFGMKEVKGFLKCIEEKII
jgi:hypothetical protein